MKFDPKKYKVAKGQTRVVNDMLSQHYAVNTRNMQPRLKKGTTL